MGSVADVLVVALGHGRVQYVSHDLWQHRIDGHQNTGRKGTT